MKTITAIIADTHVGSWAGLSLPSWSCDTGTLNADGTPQYKVVLATPAQLWLHEKFGIFHSYVKELAKKYRARIVVIHLGDVIDGIHHANEGCSLPNLDDQENEAAAILEDFATVADKFYITRGTSAHVGVMAQSEKRIADKLSAVCVFDALLDIDGTLLDVAHQGRASCREWTSAAPGMAAQAVLNAAIHQRRIPRYVFRAHNHVMDDSGERINGTRAIACPSWSLKTSHSYRLAPNLTSDIGGIIMLPDGELDFSMSRFYEAPGHNQIIVV